MGIAGGLGGFFKWAFGLFSLTNKSLRREAEMKTMRNTNKRDSDIILLVVGLI